MKVSVVYANPSASFWTTGRPPRGVQGPGRHRPHPASCAQFPEIDLAAQKVGVFSKVVASTAPWKTATGIEIYRPLTADPKTIQARAKAKGKAATGAD